MPKGLLSFLFKHPENLTVCYLNLTPEAFSPERLFSEQQLIPEQRLLVVVGIKI